jgi:hypothetical protein
MPTSSKKIATGSVVVPSIYNGKRVCCVIPVKKGFYKLARFDFK